MPMWTPRRDDATRRHGRPAGTRGNGRHKQQTHTGKYSTCDVAVAVAALLSDTLAELVDEREAAGLSVHRLVPLVVDARYLMRDVFDVLPHLDCEAARKGGQG